MKRVEARTESLCTEMTKTEMEKKIQSYWKRMRPYCLASGLDWAKLPTFMNLLKTF